jgi:hypothetical protein
MFKKNSMKFHGISVETEVDEIHGIPWKISWNLVNSWNFMKFGFDRALHSITP